MTPLSYFQINNKFKLVEIALLFGFLHQTAF